MVLPSRRRPSASTVSSSAVTIVLITCCITFVFVQVRMLLSNTECSDKVRTLLDSERKWSKEARELRLNLSSLSKSAAQMENRLQITQKDFRDATKALTSVERSIETQKQLLQQAKDASWKQTEAKRAMAEAGAGGKHMELRGEQHQQHPDGQQEASLATGRSESERDSDESAGRPEDAIAAVVVMVCNRPGYLVRTIKSILEVHTSRTKFPLFISQDGTHEEVKKTAIRSRQFKYIQHIEKTRPAMNSPNENIAYYRIAEHYKFALSYLFEERKFPRVLILEDDMELSPDFFDYFEATSHLMDKDETILAVSSWNDNGQDRFVSNPEALYRSDFFPGLGWMLNRNLWAELAPKWPRAYWDDWLRLPENRKGRQSIRPEICRTYNFGEVGSSFGQFFRDYLAPIKLNDVKTSWNQKDLSYLMNENYARQFVADVKAVKKTVSAAELHQARALDEDVIVEYTDQASFAAAARQLGIFKEWKAGIPRVSYKGVVCIRYKGSHLVYLVNWNVLNKPDEHTSIPAL